MLPQFTAMLGILSFLAMATNSSYPPTITNSLGMELVMIKPGSFEMGSPEDESGRDTDEGPLHKVEIQHPIYLSKYEVTRGQFGQFVEATKYQTEAEKSGQGSYGLDESSNWVKKPEWTWRNAGFPQTDDHPVVNINWNDAVAFAKWLASVEHKEYRLPTEAEWEYAARAGTSTRYFTGANAKSLEGYANVADASVKKKFPTWSVFPFDDNYAFTAPVGKFKANPWGLHDMTGNVWEWCLDSYDANYYRQSPNKNPLNEKDTGTRVTRGSSWAGNPPGSRVASRLKVMPSDSSSVRGFRVAALVR
jgi:formylglycine-generating enzyme